MPSSLWWNAELPALLRQSVGTVSPRQYRQFNCWCAHVVRHLIIDRRSLLALKLAELMASGRGPAVVPPSALAAAQAAITDLQRRHQKNRPGDPVTRSNCLSAMVVSHALSNRMPNGGALATAVFATHALQGDAGFCPLAGWAGSSPAQYLASAFRRVVPDPADTPEIVDAWRTRDVLDLARSMHRSRCYDGLPMLGDALEEAGCDDERLIHHCRSVPVDARADWLVDRLVSMSS